MKQPTNLLSLTWNILTVVLSFSSAEPPCCEEEACFVEGIIEDAECIDEVYIIEFDLEHEGTQGVGFDIYINNTFLSFHSYEDLPLQLEVNKNVFPSPFYITACENDNEECCSTVLFDLNDVSVTDLLPDDAIQVLLRDQQLLLETELNVPMKAHLIALDGRRLNAVAFNYNTTITLEGYPSGMYILFVESELGIYTEKIAFIR